MAQQTDLTEPQWEMIGPLVEQKHRRGRLATNRREVGRHERCLAAMKPVATARIASGVTWASVSTSCVTRGEPP